MKASSFQMEKAFTGWTSILDSTGRFNYSQPKLEMVRLILLTLIRWMLYLIQAPHSFSFQPGSTCSLLASFTKLKIATRTPKILCIIASAKVFMTKDGLKSL